MSASQDCRKRTFMPQPQRGSLTMNVRLYSSASLSKLILLVTFAALCVAPLALAQTSYKFDAATVSGLPARNIGSATMSGRIAALDAVEQDGRITVFIGAASGGGWKSVSGGTAYKRVFDHESVQSIGADAINPTNPKTVR